MYIYKLYSEDNPNGVEIARALDDSISQTLESYFQRTYKIGDERFAVTKRKLRARKETKVSGSRKVEGITFY